MTPHFSLIKGLNYSSCSNERKISSWIFKTKRYGQTRKGINYDMKQQPGKLGIREYISIVILMVGAKATEDTPAILYSNVQNAAWMIPILSGAIFFIPLFLLLKTLSLFQGKNLFDVIQKLFGKYIGFVVCLSHIHHYFICHFVRFKNLYKYY